MIVFSRTAEDPLHRVSAEGGEQVPVATLQKDEKFHLWPWFLPDGQHFLFTVAGSKETSGIYVGSIRSKLRKKVASTGVLPHVTPVMYSRGHIFYIRNSRALVTQPFDVDNLEVRGEPVVIDDEIEFTGPGRVPMSVSESGMLVYRKAGAPVIEQLAFVDRTGREGARVGKGGPVEVARFSPDGRRLLISYRSPLGSIWVHDLERGTETKMTFEPWATLGAWIDDESFAFSAATDAPPNLFLKRSQGDSIRLTNTDRQQYVTDVSPDGRFVVYVTDDAQTSFDLQAMPITPPHDSIPLVSSPAMESNGRVSPDGRWLAYTSNESGRAQVYVTAFPKAGRRWQISTDGASIPLWSADGRELYYDDLSGRQLMAVKIERSGSELRPAKPQVLFPLTGTIHDVDSLGRFLIGTPHLNPDSPPLTIVANWQPPGQ